MHFSDHSFEAVFLQIFCLSSLWEEGSALSALSQQRLLKFKTVGFSGLMCEVACAGLLGVSLPVLGLREV